MEFVRLINENIKVIKVVKIQSQVDLRSAFNDDMNPELHQKNLSEMNRQEGYCRFRTYYVPIGFPDVLMKISSDLERRQLTAFLNECIAQIK